MGILRRLFASILLILNAIVSVLLVASSYVEYISPAYISLPALLGLAFPVFVVANIIFIPIWMLIYPRYILYPFVALLLSSPAIWKYCPIHFDSYIETNHEGFTLLSYNVYQFNDVVKKENPNAPVVEYNRSLQNVIDYNADIAVLQETGHAKYGRWRDTSSAQIAQLNKLYPYHISGKNSLVLSKYPITQLLDTVYTASAFTNVSQVEMNGHKITIINNHLESIGLNDSDKMLFRELTSNPDSLGGNMHNIKLMVRKFMAAFEQRAKQVNYIDSLAHSIGGNIIMCGDINDTPNSYAYRILRGQRHDAYIECGNGPGYTYRTNRMWVRIDHIFYEGDFTAQYITKGLERTSDHYPLFVRFDWN